MKNIIKRILCIILACLIAFILTLLIGWITGKYLNNDSEFIAAASALLLIDTVLSLEEKFFPKENKEMKLIIKELKEIKRKIDDI